MSKDPWIKWYPGDFLGGVSELEPNEGWVYTVVLNLIYDGGGPWPLNLERLARRCRMRPTSAKKALDALIDMGKLTLTDGCLSNRKAEKSIKSRQKVSDNSAEASRTRWEKERAKANENNGADDATAMRMQCTGDANQKLEPELDKEVAKATFVAGGDVPAAFALWNELAGRIGLPLAKALTPERRRHIKARLDQGGLEGWQEALTGVERSKHCRGQNDRGWKADLDFVCQPKSYQRLREGTYGADMPAASGVSAAPAAIWPGPPQLRAAIVAAAGEDVARGYVDTAVYRPEDRALVVRNAFMADRLRREAGPTLDRLKVTVTVAEGVAA